jgi:Mrp family chromosome partitioning ATPase
MTQPTLSITGDEHERMSSYPTPVPPNQPSDDAADLPSKLSPVADDARGALHGASTVDQLPAGLAESLHYLLARYQLGEEDSLPSPLGVVSALHQEGVTTISRALAAVVANDLDATVCWVGLSPTTAISRRRRSNRSTPETSDGALRGIFDVLTDQASLADVLESTDDDRLKLLHLGAIPETHRQTVARSSQLGSLIDELAHRFDYVILEVPPVLAGSEALAILRHAAAHLMVIRHGVTTVQQVQSAANEIRDVPSLGVVINQFRSRIPKRVSRFFAP